MSELDSGRRQLLKAAVGGACLAACTQRTSNAALVSDVTQLEAMPVARILRPQSSADVAAALHEWRGPVSIGGGRFSMGGQIAAADSLHLDMRGLNRLQWLDVSARTVRCEAGMTWRDLLDYIDPHDLSVAIMQSYSNFTIGGSVSVNCHGRYVGKGALVHAIRALRLATADGHSRELSRTQEPELFAAVIGGYGGLGVITEVELDLATNMPLERRMEQVELHDYVAWFEQEIAVNDDAVLHNADLVPPDFDAPLATTWLRSSKTPKPERLIPRGLDYDTEQNQIWLASELPGGSWLRERAQLAEFAKDALLVWRNHEASLDAASLEPRTRRMSSYLLQEYFVPARHFIEFARGMAEILRGARANVLNVSIRHAPADTLTMLSWSPEPVFCFVLYFKQRSTQAASEHSDAWTRRLIDLALRLEGRYYLPYRLAASPEQFGRAYPQAQRITAIKRQVDPQRRLRNRLWDKYLRT